MLIKGASVFLPNHQFVRKDVRIDKNMIQAVEDDLAPVFGENVVDGQGMKLIPGLVDMHLHGAQETDFSDGEVDGLLVMGQYEAMHGITAFCPTAMTYPIDVIRKAADSAVNYQHQNKKGADLVGIRLEGPFLSDQKAGAQNREYLQSPNVEFLQELLDDYPKLIRVVDIAPELPGALDFIKTFQNQVLLSIGHTTADYQQAKEGFSCGANHVTHLFNGMNGLHHRNPGPIPAALEMGATCELICDGIHVDPALIRMIFTLFGRERVILISDSMRACGLPDGVYTLGGQSVLVSGKRAVLSKQPEVLAGSVTNLYDGMVCALSMGLAPEAVIPAVTENPAKKLGVDNRFGKIETGCVANLLLVNPDWSLEKVILRGEIL